VMAVAPVLAMEIWPRTCEDGREQMFGNGRHEMSLCPGPLHTAPSPASAGSRRIIPSDGPSHLEGPTHAGPGQRTIPGARKRGAGAV
jgi:hypothetical protein